MANQSWIVATRPYSRNAQNTFNLTQFAWKLFHEFMTTCYYSLEIIFRFHRMCSTRCNRRGMKKNAIIYNIRSCINFIWRSTDYFSSSLSFTHSSNIVVLSLAMVLMSSDKFGSYTSDLLARSVLCKAFTTQSALRCVSTTPRIRSSYTEHMRHNRI